YLHSCPIPFSILFPYTSLFRSLAEFSSLSVNFISKIKRTDNQNISIQKLDAIAKALQTSVITLIDESSKTPEPQAFASKLSNDRVFLDKLTNDMKKIPVE